MTDLERLLELQAHDTTLDQLRHRRATLPERAELAAIAARRVEVEAGVAEPRAERSELARRQGRLEDEVAGVEEKVAAVDRQLYGGAITSPKEAQALQADLESLKKRQSTLEDEVLELMEAAEPLDEHLRSADDELAALAADHDRVTGVLAAAEAAVDVDIDEHLAGREALVADVPAELVATYEAMRPQFGGVAVARLQGATCQGCHLTLAAGEVDQLRREPPEALVHCPECARILVR